MAIAFLLDEPLMPTIIECPNCQRKLRIPAELAGRDVQCPTCGNTFGSAAAPVEPSPTPLPPIEFAPAGPVGAMEIPVEQPAHRPTQPAHPLPSYPGLDSSPGAGRRRCPTCGEVIRADSEWCRFCNEALPGASALPPWERGHMRRDYEPHRGGTVLALGITGLCCSTMACLVVVGLPLSVTAWIMGHIDMRRMREGEMDPEGQSQTSAGMICGIIGTVIGSLCGGAVGLAWMGALVR